MKKQNSLQRTTRQICLILIIFLFNQTTWSQTQSIITPSSVSQSQLNPSQLAKLNNLSASQLHDNFQLVEVQNLATSQVNAKVKLAISNLPCTDMIFTATKVEYISESDYYWSGFIDSDVDAPCKGGSITLMAKNGEKFGSIIFDDYSYEFQDLGDGIQALSRFKVEMVGENECGINSNTPGYRISSQPQKDNPSPNRILPCQGNCEVRVLVLWTQAAENIEANINNRIALAIAQTNQAYQNSQIAEASVRIVLAGSQRINFTETYGSNDINVLAANITAQNLRNLNQADIVVLLTNGSNYGELYGVVKAIGPNFNGAYALVQTNAATGGRFTFAHEVGHLFGARHDIDPTGTIEHGYTFNTGFIFTKQRYTLLATMPAGKTREQNYSNPDVKIKNKKTGTTNNNNNAQQHRNTGCTVANFFANALPPFTVNIDAVQQDCYQGWADAVVQCGTAPYTFNWEMSLDGLDYQPIGNTENVNFYFYCQSNTFLNLRLTVTDATSTSLTSYHHLEIGNNYPLRPAHGKPKVSDTETSTIIQRVYPNPSSSSMQVELRLPNTENISVAIIDATGNVKKQIFNGTISKGKKTITVNTAVLNSGIYQLRVTTNNKQEYYQFVVVK
jgi:hypothetical protein